MKKNNTMRAAGGLLIATLLTSSIVSGTYAKYVTSGDATDTARVAKFGVTVTASGTLFDTTYLAADDNTPGNGAAENTEGTVLTVQSSTAEKLVAPGTKNDEGLTFTITGQPEVDVQVTLDIADGLKEVFLGANTGLPDMTTSNTDDTFDNTAPYYPVKFTLTQTIGATTTELAKDATLADAADALDDLDMRYDANTNLAEAIGTLNLTWEWDFDADGAGTYDKHDTLLGDLAAGTALAPAVTLEEETDYNLTENIEIKVTVTQVD